MFFVVLLASFFFILLFFSLTQFCVTHLLLIFVFVLLRLGTLLLDLHGICFFVYICECFFFFISVLVCSLLALLCVFFFSSSEFALLLSKSVSTEFGRDGFDGKKFSVLCVFCSMLFCFVLACHNFVLALLFCVLNFFYSLRMCFGSLLALP